MARTLQQLRNGLNQARGAYGGQFAGQPRATRDPARLEQLINDVSAIASEAPGIGGTDLGREATQQADAWREELAAIREAQAGGADALKASSLAQWLRDNFERYRRHFAGRNRATRDLGLLKEITAEVERRIGEVDALMRHYSDDEIKRTHQAAVENRATYKSELDAILAARREGTLEARAARLAGLANVQFSRYRLHFGGKPRISRRRAVLEVITEVLDGIHTEMLQVRDAGVDFESHSKNIEIVENHLTTYRTELDRVRQARNTSTRADRVQALAEAANQVFKKYRDGFPGHARATRDPELLASIWEELYPVALDMEELAIEDDAEPVGSNLQKVRDSLRLYEREWVLIQRAKAEQAQPNVQ